MFFLLSWVQACQQFTYQAFERMAEGVARIG